MTTQDWMISEVANVPGVRHVVVVSADGLATAQSSGIGLDDRDRLAAACAALQSLGTGLADQFAASGMQHLTLAFDTAVLFVRSAGDGSHLAVVAEKSVDPGLVAQQMQAQVNKIGERNLSTAARVPTASPRP